MNNCLIELLDACYEIEGIILLLKEKGEKASPDIHKLLCAKVQALSQMANSMKDCESSIIEHELTIGTENFLDNESCSSEKGEAAIINVEDTYDESPSVINDASNEANNDSEIKTPLNIEQMIACHSSKDLRKAFSINDKFRFRRELFGNSDSDMTDAINLVSAMSSLCEAEEYFYHDLEWDAENEEVQEFMAIIANHFKQIENS